MMNNEIKKLTERCEFLEHEIKEYKMLMIIGWATSGSLIGAIISSLLITLTRSH